LFDFYYDKIINYVFRRTLDVEYSKDITSNVFLKALIILTALSGRMELIVLMLGYLKLLQMKLINTLENKIGIS
jgi:hypothetical protein